MTKSFVKIFTLLFFLLLSASDAVAAKVNAPRFANEDLDYVITYKWGMIHKEAAKARLSLRNVGNDYKITLTARTLPWADRIFSVRDTLTSIVGKGGFTPRRYVKVSHEGDRYARDEIRYNHAGGRVSGSVTKIRQKKKSPLTNKTLNLSGSGHVYDMLSIFYYLRLIDYSSVLRGQSVRSTIFSGSHAETVTIRPVGLETVELRGKKKSQAFHLKFRFTSKGGKKSSDDIDVWLSNDARHVPLLLVGKLPIGQVKCYLTN